MEGTRWKEGIYGETHNATQYFFVHTYCSDYLSGFVTLSGFASALFTLNIYSSTL